MNDRLWTGGHFSKALPLVQPLSRSAHRRRAPRAPASRAPPAQLETAIVICRCLRLTNLHATRAALCPRQYRRGSRADRAPI
jgi:hypothetical protein